MQNETEAAGQAQKTDRNQRRQVAKNAAENEAQVRPQVLSVRVWYFP